MFLLKGLIIPVYVVPREKTLSYWVSRNSVKTEITDIFENNLRNTRQEIPSSVTNFVAIIHGK